MVPHDGRVSDPKSIGGLDAAGAHNRHRNMARNDCPRIREARSSEGVRRGIKQLGRRLRRRGDSNDAAGSRRTGVG
jgi:hypothetical protein